MYNLKKIYKSLYFPYLLVFVSELNLIFKNFRNLINFQILKDLKKINKQ